MKFTTRPELHGSFGMVASTHWIASAAGMKMLEAGGSAADAAVAAGFVLNVVEPHLNGPLGEVPVLVKGAGEDAPKVICGQGCAPAGATIAHYRSEGLELIPGAGLLAATAPGAFDAWMLLLRDYGRLSLSEVLAPAIFYAEQGHPMLPAVAASIAGLAEVFRTEWTTSAPVWLPNGDAPRPGELFCNPDLAAMWRRLVVEGEAAGGGREAQIEAARRAFAQGFVAEAIDRYTRDACVIDSTGERRKGVLSGQDMAEWRASYETPLAVEHHGWTVWKCGFWTQGPVLLQVLKMLEKDDLSALAWDGPETTHLVTEALKRAFADRDAYYGDPEFFDIPSDTLLSERHNQTHRSEIGATASNRLTPGSIAGFEKLAESLLARAARATPDGGVGSGEPTMEHLTNPRGDTVHVDVVDQWGNMISATPSGGWLKSNPVVPGLGAPLNTRAQMYWLEEGLPTSLKPGARPRTTLTPSMARAADGTEIAFGTPGGDQQDQWQTIFLLRLIHHGLNLQEAIDGPLFHTGHLQASFYPRGVKLGHLLVEPAFPTQTIEGLRAAGHQLEISAPWAAGRLTAVARRPDGVLKGAATPRLMQAYAVGR